MFEELSNIVGKLSPNTVIYRLVGTELYEKKYDAKLPKLYHIRGRADVQYSRKKEYSCPMFFDIHFFVLLP